MFVNQFFVQRQDVLALVVIDEIEVLQKKMNKKWFSIINLQKSFIFLYNSKLTIIVTFGKSSRNYSVYQKFRHKFDKIGEVFIFESFFEVSCIF